MLRYSNTFTLGGQYSFKPVGNFVRFNSIKHKKYKLRLVTVELLFKVLLTLVHIINDGNNYFVRMFKIIL
jgi:hypothetical protein